MGAGEFHHQRRRRRHRGRHQRRARAGPATESIFNLLRELADVIVVGAGTVRMEGYSGARPPVAQRMHRQARGQSEVPPLAIVTKSGRLDRDMPVFTRTEVPPLICTCTAACDQTRQLLAGVAEVIDCSGDDPAEVDEAALLAIAAGSRTAPHPDRRRAHAARLVHPA